MELRSGWWLRCSNGCGWATQCRSCTPSHTDTNSCLVDVNIKQAQNYNLKKEPGWNVHLRNNNLQSHQSFRSPRQTDTYITVCQTHTYTHTLISNSQNHQVHSHVHGPVVCNIWHLFWLKELSCRAHSAGARFPAVSNTAWALCASLCVYVCVRVWKGWNTFFYFSIFFLIYLFSEPNASINSTSAGKCCCYDFVMEAKQLDPPACLWCRQRANACRSVGKSHLCVCVCVCL